MENNKLINFFNNNYLNEFKENPALFMKDLTEFNIYYNNLLNNNINKKEEIKISKTKKKVVQSNIRIISRNKKERQNLNGYDCYICENVN